MTESTDILDKLPELVATRDWDALRGILADLADQDIAKAIPDLAPMDRERLLAHLLSPERASNVFSHLSTEAQTEVLDVLEDEDKARIIGELHYDDAAALLDDLPDEHTELLMGMLPTEDQQILQTLLTYPEDSAGRLMTPEFIALRPDWTVGQALEHVREQHEVGETMNMVFVTGERGELLGSLRLRDLLLGHPGARVGDIAMTDVVSILTDADQEEAARIIRHYDLEVLPVVDEAGQLHGIITVDDVLDVMEEESTEDFHKMASVGVGLSLKESSAGLLYQKRIGWLVILVVVNIFSGAAIALFETAIEAVVALVFFLPLVIASGGNAGAQSSTLMVRALATGDVQARDWLRLWGKELLVSIALGTTMGLAVWGAGAWLGGADVGLAVAISMVLVVVMASMLGMVLPFALERLNFDPASASAPLITSVADVFGVLIYFSVATTILRLSLT
ncbi:magnesium transporter [Thioalkalivibrio thiocyanodenitrificans]|uniref:magnesium transporter n=1 Tax=Thioalkalivibrio thiocyanodenitrificans TaxID=243063 RepID=UPI000382304A|nr:magnesium transporter [Thioalkalivibrio thiocyanodenitrificans]